MVIATLLFALMGVCVKFASAHFGTAAVVASRGLVGAVVIGVIAQVQQVSLRTAVPMLHVRRGVSGVTALSLWFYAIGVLPLATAVTLNYMSSVWMAVFLLVGALLPGGRRVDGRLVWTVLVGFAGVALVLRPSLGAGQALAGLIGLVSGMLAATAYIQVTALGRAGEPEVRVVFYFSLISALGGLGLWLASLLLGASPAVLVVPSSAAAWAALVGAGVFATLAQLLMTRAYARGNMLVNANLQYLGVVHACVFGVLLFGDPLGLWSLVGMALIVGSGMAAARLRPQAARVAVKAESTAKAA
jgi:S-adenosylmethionine uptake transporter